MRGTLWPIWGHPGEEILSRMVDGMLSSRSQALCGRHLRRCPACQTYLEEIQRVRGVLQGLPSQEEHPLESLQPPRFIPVIRWVPSPWGVAVLTAGLLWVGLASLRPAEVPMRIISSTALISGAEAGGTLLRPGMPLKTLSAGHVDLEIAKRVLFRLKPGATVTWQQVQRPWILGGGTDIVLHVLRGEVLARTQGRFWGWNLKVRTPAASALVKGTAFSIRVESEQETTVLKVLAGKVFFSPHVEQVGLDVRAGQTSRIRGGRLPSLPQELTPQERADLLEVYRIGPDPLAALVIGAGPERVEELLRPAVMYLSIRPHPEFQQYLWKPVRQLNAAALQGEPLRDPGTLRALELALEGMSSEDLAVPLRLCVGAHYAAAGQPLAAQRHFDWVAQHHPHHPLAPLALAAAGQAALTVARDEPLARERFQRLLIQYPDSPEAEFAKQALSRLR